MEVIGAGPAGATAALAACREGAAVRVLERSAFPRHKVCGEFLSPEVLSIFRKLGVEKRFLDLHPFAVREAHVAIGRSVKSWRFDQPAFGISRFALDQFLCSEAEAAGAELVRESAKPGSGQTVVAHGRQHRAPAGARPFGFKAHFTGPVQDRIDLLFEGEMYVGINCVEGGRTNVCGLAPEHLLRRFSFQPDEMLAAYPALRNRLRSLTRTMDWLITGPLVYGGRFQTDTLPGVYLAGDALGFVDPFTGSGMLGAIATGMLAGQACARGTGIDEHLARCRKLLHAQYRNAAFFRKLLRWGVAGKLARFFPGQRLFDLTRPAVSELT